MSAASKSFGARCNRWVGFISLHRGVGNRPACRWHQTCGNASEMSRQLFVRHAELHRHSYFTGCNSEWAAKNESERGDPPVTTNTRPSCCRNHPKWSQTILNSEGRNANRLNEYPLIPDHLVSLLGGPEKAGVGGSIPSLATIYNQ
jgi:hypothetical protein